MKKNKVTESKMLVYVPPGAKLNLENTNNEVPRTEYEKRRVTFDINGVKKIVKGKYGKKTE